MYYKDPLFFAYKIHNLFSNSFQMKKKMQVEKKKRSARSAVARAC